MIVSPVGPTGPTSGMDIALQPYRRFARQALDQPADALADGRLLQRAVGDAEVAALGHAERGAGNDGDLVLADQPLGERPADPASVFTRSRQ